MITGEEDLRPLPLSDRKERLKRLLASHKDRRKQIRYVDHFETAGDAVLESACRMHFEGIVSKGVATGRFSGEMSGEFKITKKG